MGEANVQATTDAERLRSFMQHLLDDVRALETMLETGSIETGITRIGAEQELFLVDPRSFRPSFEAMAVLEAIDDPHFTTELGKFNLEVNLDPHELGPGCLRATENQLREMLAKAREGARQVGSEVLLIGILPTLEKADLSLDNMAPIARYRALADAMRAQRGKDFELHIEGRDELTSSHDSVMLEACNTSFQIHLQVEPERFAEMYNIAQLVAGPTLAPAVFSPLLLGRRLWAETRIALFQQSIDTRRGNSHHRMQRPRVRFGEQWVDDSVLDLFRQDIGHFRPLLTGETGELSSLRLERGEVPDLKALRLHNGTVYRWNRACYGILDGKPHLRIENRVLPSGPTVLDEVANAAFWFGLVRQLAKDLEDVRERIGFDAVKENFLAAARRGMKAQFHWLDGRQHTARDLVLEELLPRAREGLADLGIDGDEVDRYLPVIEERARSRRTGSQWLIDSLAALHAVGSPAERFATLTAAAFEHQNGPTPVHGWPLASGERHGDTWPGHYSRVGNLMSTDLFTVGPEEVIDLVAAIMDWRHVHHVPVEDGEHRLVGLITHRRLLRHLARERSAGPEPVAVREVMESELVTVEPSTPSLEAIRLMKEHGIACLPVVENQCLVGILTERDFMKVADGLLETFLSGDRPSAETRAAETGAAETRAAETRVAETRAAETGAAEHG